MTGSLDEVRVALALVADQLDAAQQYAGLAHVRLTEALGMLSGLAEQTARPMATEPMRSAVDALERLRGLIASGAVVVADIDARL